MIKLRKNIYLCNQKNLFLLRMKKYIFSSLFLFFNFL